MKIIIGCDHGGYDLKLEIIARLEKEGHSVVDVGCPDRNPVDYPDVAADLCHRLLDEKEDFGILICGTGIGISIALSDAYSASMAKAHNNANVITLGARTLGVELAWTIVKAYMDSSFLGGVHQTRVEKIAALEKEDK